MKAVLATGLDIESLGWMWTVSARGTPNWALPIEAFGVDIAEPFYNNFCGFGNCCVPTDCVNPRNACLSSKEMLIRF